MKGCRDALALALHQHYGFDREEAEQAICQFEKDVRYPGAIK
jgi:hypothetical protein